MPRIADRIKETTSTIGTGAISMGGAVSGYKDFASAFITGDQVYYCIDGGAEWEVGIGTLTSGAPWTMARTTVNASSNANAAVNFSAGQKYIFCTASADAIIKTSRPNWVLKSTAYTAVAGDAILADRSSAPFTILMPMTPSANEVVRIKDYKRSATNALTIDWNGNKHEELSDATMVCSAPGFDLLITYIDVTVGWKL